jgi:CheY-like chemotaxis protein
MSEKTKILSIDDNPQNIKIIERALRGDFDVISSDGNEPIMSLVANVQPDIILLDIMLENTTGYELCKQIKANDDNAEIIIIFVSALSSLSDKLDAYACGGDDYLCKPIDLTELKQKLSSLERRIQDKTQLIERCNYSSSVAFSSMKQASDLGNLITFFTDSVAMNAPDKLYAAITSYFNDLGIKCTAEFRLSQGPLQFPLTLTSSLEKEILELGRSAKGIITFGNNLLLNSPWCSLLVKHIPSDDQGEVGRMRDNVAILLSIIDNRLMLIDSEACRQGERDKALSSLRKALGSDFNKIQQAISSQEELMTSLIKNLSSELDQKILVLGLSEEQESELVTLIEDAQERLDDATGTSLLIEKQLYNINQILNVMR